jgi:polyhydroxybutyrate depolymerase
MGRRGSNRASLLAGTVLVTVVAACSACGGGSSSPPPSTRAKAPASTTTTTTPTTSTSSTTTRPGGSAVQASAGCLKSDKGVPGTETITPTIGGRQRSAIVHLPTAYVPRNPIPLVVNMHGSESTPLQQEELSGMDTASDADTFIVVYPQGGIPAGNGFEWNVPNEPLLGGAAVPANVAFIQQLVTTLEQRYCIDEHRVFATGFSGGARMASQLGCNAASMFAAVAPVSGLRLPRPCKSTRPVPVVAFHGTADPVDPYLGRGQKYWTYSVPVAAKRWGNHNRCSATPTTSQPATGVLLTTYAPCSDGSVVELYSIIGEGHEWPGGPTLPNSITKALGPQTTAISANAIMWSFFMAHPLP